MIIRAEKEIYNLKKMAKVAPDVAHSIIEFIYYKGSKIKLHKSVMIRYSSFEKRDAAFTKLCNALAKKESYVDISEDSL